MKQNAIIHIPLNARRTSRKPGVLRHATKRSIAMGGTVERVDLKREMNACVKTKLSQVSAYAKDMGAVCPAPSSLLLPVRDQHACAKKRRHPTSTASTGEKPRLAGDAPTRR